MGHTSGLGKGLFVMVVVLLAAFAVAGGVAFALASLFHHVAAFVILGGAALLAASYVAYQPRWVCLAYGSLGSLGGYIAFLLTAIFGGGFFAGCGAVGVACIAMFVGMFLLPMLPFVPKGSKSWRQAK